MLNAPNLRIWCLTTVAKTASSNYLLFFDNNMATSRSLSNNGEIASKETEQIMVNEHPENLLTRLGEFYKSKHLCDITLVCDGRKFEAHKLILASSSDYFAAMFTGGMCETEMNEVELKELNSESLENLLGFAYSGKLTLRMSNVQEIYQSADLLQFPNVLKGCVSFLLTNINIKNCLSIYPFALLYSIDVIQNYCQNIFDSNFLELSSTDEFFNLDSMSFSYILKSDNIFVTCESIIMKACMKWLQRNNIDYSTSVGLLQSVLRFKCLTPQSQAELQTFLKKLQNNNSTELEEILIPQTFNRNCSRKFYTSWLHTFGGEISFLQETRATEIYNFPNDKWCAGIELKNAKSSFACVLHNKKLYIIGGLKRDVRLKKVHCYNSLTKVWYGCPPLNNCCGDVQATVFNNSIYVAGGSSARKSVCKFVEIYNAESEEWHRAPHMMHSRRKFGLAAVNNCLYAIGGFDDSYGELSSVESYRLERNSWEAVSSMQLARYDFGTVVLSGCIYIIGGVSGTTGSMSVVEKFDPLTATWHTCCPMNVCRGGLSAAVAYGRIFALNGKNKYMRLDDTAEYYDEVKNKWYELDATSKPCCNGAAINLPFKMVMENEE